MVESRRVSGGDVLRVREQKVRVELEGDLAGDLARIECAFILSLLDGRLELAVPRGDRGHGSVSDRAGVRIDLGRDGGEEAAAGKDSALQMAEEGFAQRAEPGDSRWCLVRYPDHLGTEDLVRGLDRRELQLLFRAEVREESALAHADRVGEAADRETLDAVDRYQSCRLLEDRLAAPDSVAPLPPW